MRNLIIIVAFLFLFGCASQPKFTIPDEPKFENVTVYPVQGGILMSTEDVKSLRNSIADLQNYANKPRKTLERIKENE